MGGTWAEWDARQHPEYRVLPRRSVNAPKDGPTERQMAIFAFIYEHARDKGFQPTLRELGEHFGIRSPNGLMCHLRSLRKQGFIGEPEAGSRCIPIYKKPDGSPFTGFAEK